jgi:hypothetical protein
MVPPELPNEIGSLYQLRLKYPHRLYSELLDAFTMARSIMPAGTLEEQKTIASYILDTSVPRQSVSDDSVPI